MLLTLIRTTRPAFLLLTVAVVALAAALATQHSQPLPLELVALVLFGALTAHAGVNVLNEVHDARSGLDSLTQRTPFSGGSGALQEHPAAINAAALMGKVLLILVTAIGCFFIYLRGLQLLPLGLAGLLLVISYTPIITHRPWLCLIAPGLGFGPLMVMGSYFVLTGEYTASVFWVSLIPFFLVNNLLLLNQFPDAAADIEVGRRNLLTAYGPRVASITFRIFLGLTYVLLALFLVVEVLPPPAALGFISLVVALPLYRASVTLDKPLPTRLLALNVVLTISLPLLISLGLLLH